MGSLLSVAVSSIWQAAVIAIDVIAVENEYAEDMYQRSELEWLIYNALREYAELVMEGDARKYLREVTEYRRLD